MDPVRVLIVDDSALVRRILSTGLAGDPRLQVVGTAGDPYEARDRIQELKPAVVTLDVEMPRMDGLAFLQRLMPQRPTPVVMVSSLTEHGKSITLSCLEAGAVDCVAKPSVDVGRGLEAMMQELRDKVVAASLVDVSRFKIARHLLRPPAPMQALPQSTDRVLAVGASTGGTEAFRHILGALPRPVPPTVVVQHMPAGFTQLYAERLAQVTGHDVREAADGDRILPGRVLIAPGGRQLTVERSGGHYLVRFGGTEKRSGHCPSVDTLFHSVASACAANAVGVILTGMGADGAAGLLEMRKAGARTVAQDESTSVVWGMPKVAIDLGAAENILPLDQIPAKIHALMRPKDG
jgi:two-component system chemotaxis response regulator CheB